MSAREKAPDGAEPLIIQEGGEPTSKDDKPADWGAALRKNAPDDLRQTCPILGTDSPRFQRCPGPAGKVALKVL